MTSDDPHTRPLYVVVIDELGDQPWSTGLSLAEILEPGHQRPREPEADLEAEP